MKVGATELLFLCYDSFVTAETVSRPTRTEIDTSAKGPVEPGFIGVI